MTMYHRNICVTSGGGQRPQGYFVNRMEEWEPTEAICRYIRESGFVNLGIFQREDDYQYPYWAMLKEQMSRMEHVNVSGESAVYTDTEYVPECIIWLGEYPGDRFEWNGQEYIPGFEARENRYVLVKAD